MGSTTGILSGLLLAGTLVSLIFASVFAVMISGRFAKPVDLLCEQARKLADGKPESALNTGFCKELDELSDILYRTGRKLRKNEESRKEFLANIAHDLRTPLSIIKGYAELIRSDPDADADDIEHDLSVIIMETDRLAALTGDILDYALLKSGTCGLTCSYWDMGELADETAKLFDPICRDSQYTVLKHIDSPALVYADSIQISRVLYNLIDNALSYTDNSGTIEISVKNLDNCIHTEITDHGPGIDPEDLPYIWDRYFTMKQQKRNKKGTGLGLAISRDILKAHGADYGAESNGHSGSTFWFELPPPA